MSAVRQLNERLPEGRTGPSVDEALQILEQLDARTRELEGFLRDRGRLVRALNECDEQGGALIEGTPGLLEELARRDPEGYGWWWDEVRAERERLF